ncbi:MAG: hypothetical protein IPM24_06070 [Bryobacterales bacterium]|nr:hypothetical protein [Bryobacterales bacterium]
MSQLDDAIARYHKLLQSEPYRDLSWVTALRERMDAEELSAGGRLLCPFLRPHFIPRRQYDQVVKTGHLLISAIDRLQLEVLANPALMNRLELLPAEKMLAAIDPGYKALEVTSRLDMSVDNGSTQLIQYNADSPTGVAWADGLTELFYQAPPVKEFRHKHPLTRTSGRKHLLHGLLTAYKQSGGHRRPRIAVVDLGSSFASASTEFSLFRSFFRSEGYETELVSPDQLEFKGGVLRRGSFVIDLVYRRVSVQEFLQRFDLSHPLVQAYRAKAVCLVNSFRSELAHKKAFLALLTDESIVRKFPAAERKVIRDHVPWTRLVSANRTTYREESIDLPEFILKNRERLVLRPNDDYTGLGTFYGWEMDDAAWERAVRQGVRTTYVVQERVDAPRFTFPLETFGPIEFREMRVNLHLQAALGKIHSCSSWLTASSSTGFSFTSGLAPTFVLESTR